MNVVDIIFAAVACLGLAVGLIKGTIRQLITTIGITAIFVGGRLLTPLVKGWIGWDQKLIYLICMVAIGIIYEIISNLVERPARRVRVNGFSRFVGAVVSVCSIYLIGAVAIKTIILLNGMFGIDIAFLNESWVVANIYSINPIGDWITSIIH